VILLGITVFPLLYAVALAFARIDIQSGSWSWVGFRNFSSVLTDPRFFNSLRVVSVIGVTALALEFILGLILALILVRKVVAQTLVLPLLLIPMAIAPIAAAEIWRLIFNADYGPVNYLLSELFGVQPIIWLNDQTYSLMALIITDVWQWTPFIMMLLYAGLLGVSPEIIDAACVDGANYLQTLLHIRLPLLKPVIMITLIIRGVELVKMFELPYAMTGGGPGTATETPAMYIYRTGFYFWDLPRAAVMSFGLLVITVTLVTLYMRRLMKYE
jgi:multiple sugar transport system permease protein